MVVYSLITIAGLVFVGSARFVQPILFAFGAQIPWIELPAPKYQLPSAFTMRFRRVVTIAPLFALFSSVCSVCQPAAGSLPKDPMAMMALAREKNGLTGDDIKPWHMRGTYHRYKFGHLYYEGKYEEWWFNPGEYKLNFITPRFTQTDYATRGSLLRDGGQEWLSGPELLLHASLLEPLPEPALLSDFRLHRYTRSIRKSKLDCVTFRYKTHTGPSWEDDRFPIACVEPNTPVLRVFSQGVDGLEIQYDKIAVFQDRYIAHQIRVFQGSDKQLVADLDVDLVEGFEQPADPIVTPPLSAIPVDLSRIEATYTGLSFWPVALKVAIPDLGPPPPGSSERTTADSPQHPDALGINRDVPPEFGAELNPPRTDGPSGRVLVKVSIGPDGRVKNATIISGLPPLRQKSLDAAREWVFRPFTIIGQPRTVDTVVSFGN